MPAAEPESEAAISPPSPERERRKEQSPLWAAWARDELGEVHSPEKAPSQEQPRSPKATTPLGSLSPSGSAAPRSDEESELALARACADLAELRAENGRLQGLVGASSYRDIPGGELASLREENARLQRALRDADQRFRDAEAKRLTDADGTQRRMTEMAKEVQRLRAALEDSDSLRKKEVADAWAAAEVAEAKYEQAKSALREMFAKTEEGAGARPRRRRRPSPSGDRTCSGSGEEVWSRPGGSRPPEAQQEDFFGTFGAPGRETLAERLAGLAAAEEMGGKADLGAHAGFGFGQCAVRRSSKVLLGGSRTAQHRQ